jgi:riboflavin synthase
MFTGIIEEIGKISAVNQISGGKRFCISAHTVLSDLTVNDSVAVSGVCLTVIYNDNDHFQVEAVGDTLTKTTLNQIRRGAEVNLERALRLNDRLGGHFVQGHVSGIGKVVHFTRIGENWSLKIDLPDQLLHYIIPEGSIAIDGISLTIAGIDEQTIRISVIPHTYRNTTMPSYQTGQAVNIETDFLGKYVEKFVRGASRNSKITEPWLKSLGY